MLKVGMWPYGDYSIGGKEFKNSSLVVVHTLLILYFTAFIALFVFSDLALLLTPKLKYSFIKE
jgi:hypothetical protein